MFLLCKNSKLKVTIVIVDFQIKSFIIVAVGNSFSLSVYDV